MAGSSKKPQKVHLACKVCGVRNYYVAKPKSNLERLELKKYCKRCDEHLLHLETK